jgi:hypothetical protein
VLSPAAVDSEQVEAEWVTGLEEKKHIVPILYQTCRIPSRLRLIQRFDFTNRGLENEGSMEALVRVLGGRQTELVAQPKGKEQVLSQGVDSTKSTGIASPSVQQSLVRNSIGMKFVLIPAGEFRMGADDKGAYDDERPVHRVRISRPFYLGKYPVTQGQWESVMQSNPSSFKGDPNRPVENVSWEDTQEFLKRLSEKDGKPYRLPTEAEWEYAARAGTTTAYCFGDDVRQLREYGWYSENSGEKTHPVGQLDANAWGCTICTAMCGSGCRIGMWRIITSRAPSLTRKVLRRENFGLCAAARGSLSQGTSVYPPATGTPLAAAAAQRFSLCLVEALLGSEFWVSGFWGSRGLRPWSSLWVGMRFL